MAIDILTSLYSGTLCRSALSHEFPPPIFSPRSIFSSLFRHVTSFVFLHATSLIPGSVRNHSSPPRYRHFPPRREGFSQLEASTALPIPHSPSLLKRLNHTIICFLRNRTYYSPVRNARAIIVKRNLFRGSASISEYCFK